MVYEFVNLHYLRSHSNPALLLSLSIHACIRTLGMIFELCEGGQLNKLLHTPNNMPLNNFSSAEKLRMSKDIAIGLTYLHSLR